MYFSTVEITPSTTKKHKWEVSFRDLPLDRVDGEGFCSSMGFSHYPRQQGKREAFAQLKDKMIARHKEEISRLTKSLEALQRLELGSDVTLNLTGFSLEWEGLGPK